MTTTRKVTRRKVTKKSAAPTRPHPGKNVEVKVEVTIMVSTGAGDPRSIDEIREDIKADLKNPNGKTRAKLVTNMGGYYLVDGKVCLPDDYDPNTRGFKPGAHPPLWAMGPDERDVLKRIEREKATRPAMARNPENLRTSEETDALHAKESRIARTKAALDDLHENTEWGKQKKQEREEAARSASEEEFEEDEFEEETDDEEEEPYFEDEEDEEDDPEDEFEEEEFEPEWDEDDPMNDEVADEAIESQTSSALAKLKSGTNGKRSRKVTTVAKPTTKKKVVRRR